MHAPDKVKLADEEAVTRATELAEVHKEVKLSREQLLKISNWVDTNAQYYGMYWVWNTKTIPISDRSRHSKGQLATRA